MCVFNGSNCAYWQTILQELFNMSLMVVDEAAFQKMSDPGSENYRKTSAFRRLRCPL